MHLTAFRGKTGLLGFTTLIQEGDYIFLLLFELGNQNKTKHFFSLYPQTGATCSHENVKHISENSKTGLCDIHFTHEKARDIQLLLKCQNAPKMLCR